MVEKATEGAAEMAPIRRSSRPYLILLALAAILAIEYRPSAKSAQIETPLTLPRIRKMELGGAEWAVKRHLEVWDNVSFRNEHIEHRQGRVAVCGEVQLGPDADFQPYVVINGRAALAGDAQSELHQVWLEFCTI